MTVSVSKPLLDVLKGKATEVPPMWLMRQAGRYLPEYRELRAQKGGFLELAYDSDAAAEITLQPIRRFGFDGAILFSDILVVPHAMGQDLWFEAGEGPRLAPKLAESDWRKLVPQPNRLLPVYETIRKVPGHTAGQYDLLGLCRKPLDGRYLHGCGTGQQGPCGGPRYGLRRSHGLCRAD